MLLFFLPSEIYLNCNFTYNYVFLQIMQKFSGFVSIIGLPNSGKSTLLNAVLGEQISIVTPKPQTTRNNIFGIYTKNNYQIVFIDTPGILEPKYKMHKYMKNEISHSLKDSDLILTVIDAANYKFINFKKDFKNVLPAIQKINSICVLNKIDLIKKENLLLLIDEVRKIFIFDEIIPVSALKNFNISELIKIIYKYLPENEFYYNNEIITPQSEKFFVSEIIRMNILKIFKDEIPFSVFVDIDEFTERTKGKYYIKVIIYVEKESQKAILIGNAGSKIKKLGELSRKLIEDFLNHSIFLDMYVKVKKNWKNDDAFLKRNFNKLSAAIN